MKGVNGLVQIDFSDEGDEKQDEQLHFHSAKNNYYAYVPLPYLKCLWVKTFEHGVSLCFYATK